MESFAAWRARPRGALFSDGVLLVAFSSATYLGPKMGGGQWGIDPRLVATLKAKTQGRKGGIWDLKGELSLALRLCVLIPALQVFLVRAVFHARPATAGRRSNQKRLPWLGADSTPAWPPIRATPSFTMASPMPVPA